MSNQTRLYFKCMCAVLLAVLSACGKNGEQNFSEQFRKALGVQPLSNASTATRGKLITPSENDLLSQKNSIKACPEDSNLQGKAFPNGRSQWCAYKDSKNIEVRHGEYRVWHNNGKVKIQCFYSDGEIDGSYREWFDDGVMKESSTYSKGKKNGKSTIYSKEGKILEEGEYADDYKQGLYVKYSRLSKPLIKGTYNKDQKHGIWESYDQNGHLKEKTEYQADVKHGRTNKYGNNNILIATGYYDRGSEVGHWIYYDNKGSKLNEGNLLNGKRHGKWVDYNKEGQIQRIHYFDNGRRTDSVKVHGTDANNQSFGSRDILGAEPPLKRNNRQNREDNKSRYERPSPFKKDNGWAPL